MKIGILGDIHEDVIRLEQALKIFHTQACDDIVCLGDITGYSHQFNNFPESRNASACLDLVKKHCSLVLAGNHDLWTLQKTTDITKQFYFPENWYSLPFEEREKIGKGHVWLYPDEDAPTLLPDQFEYLDSLPVTAVKEYNGLRILFSHFCFPDPSGSEVFLPSKPSDLQDHFAAMKENHASISFSGHYHSNGILWGQPGRIRFRPMGSYRVRAMPLWVVAPPLGQGTHQNGILILNTNSMKIQVIPLKSPVKRHENQLPWKKP